jgi:hypothetical protein
MTLPTVTAPGVIAGSHVTAPGVIAGSHILAGSHK